jgi:hypothetical protein
MVLALAAALPGHARAGVCIDSYRIDHTAVPDDGQILFYMRDRSVYQAKMLGSCTGLSNDTRGFTYEPIPGNDEICGNLLTIRLNTSHAVCMVGDIALIKQRQH